MSLLLLLIFPTPGSASSSKPNSSGASALKTGSSVVYVKYVCPYEYEVVNAATNARFRLTTNITGAHVRSTDRACCSVSFTPDICALIIKQTSHSSYFEVTFVVAKEEEGNPMRLPST